MDALNTLRAILVGCALVAALMLGFTGQWFPAAVLGLGIAAHLWLFSHQRALKRREAEEAPYRELLGG